MAQPNFRKIKAIEYQNKERIKKLCPGIDERSGIYVFKREENGFKYAYIGQAKHLLTRLAQHLSGYQHIDLSIKKHKFWSEENPTGYKIGFVYFEEDMLDDAEQYYIKLYANSGYQLRNKTSGSQGQGKTDIADEPRKGYQEGLHNGYEKARKEVKHLFDLHLNYDVKKQGNKVQEKAKSKFEEFIK